jgi:hypothetical protein
VEVLGMLQLRLWFRPAVTSDQMMVDVDVCVSDG